ncbi:MAG: HlyD family efflux transporter periplasmic adaptor subunit [Caldilineaceae bacterium]|nr:HlyD family efflux transporter periplasmic adaptor subunit [Caldilineaceae bacterium]
MMRFLTQLAALVLSLFLAGCALLPTGSTPVQNPFAGQQQNEPTPTPIPTAIVPMRPTYRVQNGEIVRATSFTGRVAPVVTHELFFRSGGRVRTLYAARNDMVKAGDVIADLEIDDLERELISAQLNLERAESRLAEAEANLEFDRRTAEINLDIIKLRLTDLRRREPDNLIGLAIQQKQVELAELALERLASGVDPLLENDVERARLALEKLNTEIDNARVIAPIDGRLLTVSLTVGRPVEPFVPVVVVADTSELEVTSDLTSSQLQELSEGMSVVLRMVGRPGQTLTGTIRRLPYPFGTGGGASVQDLDRSTRVAVEQSAEEIGYSLGDLMQIEVELDRKENILWLPPQAIRTFDGRRFVVIQDEDAQRRVDVRVGIQTPDRVEIVEGLEVDQVVVGQ